MVRGSRKVLYFKYADYKKAIVIFDRSLTDVGKGMRIPEIDDIDVNDDDDDEDEMDSPQRWVKPIHIAS